MTASKRAFDLIVAGIMGALLVLPGLAVAAYLLLRQGRPIFYLSERMKTDTEAFTLIKFRTMTVTETDSGVTGADKAARVTPAGRFMRKSRLDEIPQIWNVLRGDISLVGPRPPLRQYVERFPDIYAAVLQSRPGITGLATLKYHGHEERLLARCDTPEATDAVYARICVPAKAKLDLIYQKNRSVCWDALILWRTINR